MLPNELFLGVTMYDILFAVGLVSALVVFRLFSDRLGVPARLLNFVLATAVAAMLVGVFSSVLFQAVYNYQETGVFRLASDTGMTFYGGFLGGAAAFFAVYFGVGHFVFRDRQHIKYLLTIFNIGACCIAIAHCIGRLGCLCAGCCHGIHADPPLGWYMEFAGDTVLPVQLFESLFLGALFVFLTWRTLHRKRYSFPIYLVTYGVWRFAIEYLRGDDRGSSLVSWLSPSQLTAIVLIICGAALYFVERYLRNVTERDNEAS